MDGFAFLIAVVTFVMAFVALRRTSALRKVNVQLLQEIDRLKAARPTAELVPIQATAQATAEARCQRGLKLREDKQFDDAAWLCQRWLEILPMPIYEKQMLIAKQNSEAARQFLRRLIAQ